MDAYRSAKPGGLLTDPRPGGGSRLSPPQGPQQLREAAEERLLSAEENTHPAPDDQSAPTREDALRAADEQRAPPVGGQSQDEYPSAADLRPPLDDGKEPLVTDQTGPEPLKQPGGGGFESSVGVAAFRSTWTLRHPEKVWDSVADRMATQEPPAAAYPTRRPGARGYYTGGDDDDTGTRPVDSVPVSSPAWDQPF